MTFSRSELLRPLVFASSSPALIRSRVLHPSVLADPCASVVVADPDGSLESHCAAARSSLGPVCRLRPFSFPNVLAPDFLVGHLDPWYRDEFVFALASSILGPQAPDPCRHFLAAVLLLLLESPPGLPDDVRSGLPSLGLAHHLLSRPVPELESLWPHWRSLASSPVIEYHFAAFAAAPGRSAFLARLSRSLFAFSVLPSPRYPLDLRSMAGSLTADASTRLGVPTHSLDLPDHLLRRIQHAEWSPLTLFLQLPVPAFLRVMLTACAFHAVSRPGPGPLRVRFVLPCSALVPELASLARSSLAASRASFTVFSSHACQSPLPGFVSVDVSHCTAVPPRSPLPEAAALVWPGI